MRTYRVWSKARLENSAHMFIEAKGVVRIVTASAGRACDLLNLASVSMQHDDLEALAQEASDIHRRLIALEKKMGQVREL